MSNNKYSSIIDLPYRKSSRHTPMSIEARSAQFAPFAALTGYEEAIIETARRTEKRITLDDKYADILNEKLRWLEDNTSIRPEVSITYFIPDKRKSGGSYTTIVGCVRRVDPVNQVIILTDKRTIFFSDVVSITGEIFNELDNK